MTGMGAIWRNVLARFQVRPARPAQKWGRFYLPQQVVQDTGDFIASYGDEQGSHEGVAYWAGVAAGQNLVVTTVLAPEATTTAGSFATSVIANARVVAKVNEHHIKILAQIHGHPGGWVGHSAGDNAGAFMPYEGFYSVVVPWYGRHGLLPLTRCGVHRFHRGAFMQLTYDQIERQFLILPGRLDLRKEMGGKVETR